MDCLLPSYQQRHSVGTQGRDGNEPTGQRKPREKRGRVEEKGLQKTYRDRVRQEGERSKTVKPAVIGPRCYPANRCCATFHSHCDNNVAMLDCQKDRSVA